VAKSGYKVAKSGHTPTKSGYFLAQNRLLSALSAAKVFAVSEFLLIFAP